METVLDISDAPGAGTTIREKAQKCPKKLCSGNESVEYYEPSHRPSSRENRPTEIVSRRNATHNSFEAFYLNGCNVHLNSRPI